MKECRSCNEVKSFDGFYKDKRNKDGVRVYCKDCTKEKARKGYVKDIDKQRERSLKYYHKNEKVIKEKRKKYKSTKEFKTHQRLYQKEKYANDPEFKLGILIRGFCRRVTDAVKEQKELHSLEYLGCSLDEFKLHIESLWVEGMSWANHGDWHIDHKVPLDYFVKNSDDPWEANHYTNLQPLWAADNLSKGASI